MRWTISALAFPLLVSCVAAQSPAAVQCKPSGERRLLPRDIAESSGLALSASRAGLMWTHNDRGNEPVLFALDSMSAVVGQVRITSSAITDWEDIEAAACATGRCLYIADIGDNDGRRAEIAIHEVTEPTSLSGSTAIARTIRLRYPDRPQDAEALVRTSNGDFYIVTKGRHGPIRLYRLPNARAHEPAATLELIGEIAQKPSSNRGFVTSAALSPDGRWIALRTYEDLRFFPAASFLKGQASSPVIVDVSGLNLQQSEAVAIGAEGSVWLTTEAEARNQQPAIARLACQFDR